MARLASRDSKARVATQRRESRLKGATQPKGATQQKSATQQKGATQQEGATQQKGLFVATIEARQLDYLNKNIHLQQVNIVLKNSM